RMTIATTLTGLGRAAAATLLASALLPPTAIAGPTAGDRAVASAESRVARDGGSPDGLVAPAAALMPKARETGDPRSHDRAGSAVTRARAADPTDYGALRTSAWVLLGRHEFARAARAAKQARAARPDDWWNYGNLADACV